MNGWGACGLYYATAATYNNLKGCRGIVGPTSSDHSSSIGNFKSKEEEKRPLGKKESSIYLNFEFPHTPDGDDVAGCFLIESSECQSLLQLSLSTLYNYYMIIVWAESCKSEMQEIDR